MDSEVAAKLTSEQPWITDDIADHRRLDRRDQHWLHGE